MQTRILGVALIVAAIALAIEAFILYGHAWIGSSQHSLAAWKLLAILSAASLVLGLLLQIKRRAGN